MAAHGLEELLSKDLERHEVRAALAAAVGHQEDDLVLALGVLHLSGLALFRELADEGQAPARRSRAFSALGEGFIPPAGSARTAFGTLPLARLPRETPGVLRLDRRGILKDEFSLDLFLSLVGLYAERHGVEPLSVLPVYVGMTRNPLSGSFEGAASLARALRQLVTPRTAVVATGDLVHYGRGLRRRGASAGHADGRGGSPRLLRKRGRGDASPRPGGP